MKRLLTMDKELVLQNDVAVLRGVQPVVNGRLVATERVEIVENSATYLELHYIAPSLPHGHFGVEVVQEEQQGRLWLRYWLEALPDGLVLDSFGLRFASIENLGAYLRQGNSSWDGSFYVQPTLRDDLSAGEPPGSTGYAMTQILPRNGRGSLVIGFDRHDRYQQTFTFDTANQPFCLTVQTWWDQKERGNHPRCASERLLFFTHEQVEAGLREWAHIVAAASPTPPRVRGEPMTGWCSWYNLYASITEENILDHLRGATAVVRSEKLPVRIFQIDDGFTPEMGDWLEVKPQFPNGMKPLLDEIRAAGFIPGLWIAPFMVGNRSRLYRQHPEWVVSDQKTGGPLVQMRFYGEFRWHKRSEEYYILDTTHPDAFAYLRKVFRIWRHEWGCGYFKTDFMHFGSDHGPDRARWHTPGLTRIEIWRRVAEMIRDEIGDALWLGCGSPLWAPVGLVDGIRIGRDVGVTWERESPTQLLLRDQATRNFANHILWQGDPDCVLLRERFHYLSEAEIRSLALYAGMAGGVMMTSDHLDELSPERLQLWRLLLGWSQSGCDFPLLGQTEIVYEQTVNGRREGGGAPALDPLLVQVRRPRTENGVGSLLVFNPGGQSQQGSYDLSLLGIPLPVYLYDWVEKRPSPERVTQIELTLPAHDSRLFFFSRNDPTGFATGIEAKSSR